MAVLNENMEKTQFTPEVQQQLNIIDQSMFFARVTMGSLLLSYYAIGIERQKIICGVKNKKCCECLPSVYPIKMTSSIMVLFALYYYFCLAKKTASQPSSDAIKRNSQNLNYLATSLALFVGLIRFYDLNFVENCSSNKREQAQLLEQLVVDI
ncbi:hypothetical protein RBG61_02990 [Paludicola sp. MB14-C6]|uniref:hypothetical protein n=1 Tax=Paludihabitans sp. MB14-C6 TaxID=3070656 RepID=UPI0027DE4275|nr:hypothetical protein [Paludicola sp. MB14-C6]WMJ23648.1 hypothetical protein RBG61_02990 [Paludicola sp. MB14-C6]